MGDGHSASCCVSALHVQDQAKKRAGSGATSQASSFTNTAEWTAEVHVACRITGKKTNPHLVRDSIVTYLRGTGASERELEALAIYMGHSLEMQRGTYDRSATWQKISSVPVRMFLFTASQKKGCCCC